MKELSPDRIEGLAILLNFACNHYIPRGYIQTQLQLYAIEALNELRKIKENEHNN